MNVFAVARVEVLQHRHEPTRGDVRPNMKARESRNTRATQGELPGGFPIAGANDRGRGDNQSGGLGVWVHAGACVPGGGWS